MAEGRKIPSKLVSRKELNLMLMRVIDGTRQYNTPIDVTADYDNLDLRILGAEEQVVLFTKRRMDGPDDIKALKDWSNLLKALYARREERDAARKSDAGKPDRPRVVRKKA